MTMVGMRATSVPVLAVTAYLAVRSPAGALTEDHHPALTSRQLALVVVIGLFDVTANLLFANATVSGSLAVVAVLGSLYPAATVLLARIVNGERIPPLRNFGVPAAIIGVALISLGS